MVVALELGCVCVNKPEGGQAFFYAVTIPICLGFLVLGDRGVSRDPLSPLVQFRDEGS